MYWLEADDLVKIIWEGRTEWHWAQSVQVPFDGSPMRVRTRQLAVTDPGRVGEVL
jgi:hypothetical protein